MYDYNSFLPGLLIAGYAGAGSCMDAEILITSLNGEEAAVATTKGGKPQTEHRVKCARNTLTAKGLVGVIAQRDASHPPLKQKGPKRPAGSLYSPRN
jgi:hypothetical protein